MPSRGFAYQVNAKDGTKRIVEASVSLKRDASGKPVGFRGVKRDITARRLAEESFEQHLKEFLAMVSSVSDGDLTRRGGETDDTLGSVAQSVNKMLDHFSKMLTEVKQIGLSVSSSATEILAAAEQIAVGSQRQADEITNTSSAVEEMAASMNQVSRNAEASADAARRALEMAEHGDKSVRDTSEAMSRIDSAVQQTSEKMRLLGIRSSEISEIIDLINDIAAQTNLLALNAAIEAAHAGEAGLGFSVVADEIRKLAERSARATRDVGNLIKSIQTETSEALTAMELGMKEVRGGSHLATEASNALRDISEAVRQSSEADRGNLGGIGGTGSCDEQCGRGYADHIQHYSRNISRGSRNRTNDRGHGGACRSPEQVNLAVQGKGRLHPPVLVRCANLTGERI